MCSSLGRTSHLGQKANWALCQKRFVGFLTYSLGWLFMASLNPWPESWSSHIHFSLGSVTLSIGQVTLRSTVSALFLVIDLGIPMRRLLNWIQSNCGLLKVRVSECLNSSKLSYMTNDYCGDSLTWNRKATSLVGYIKEHICPLAGSAVSTPHMTPCC